MSNSEPTHTTSPAKRYVLKYINFNSAPRDVEDATKTQSRTKRIKPNPKEKAFKESEDLGNEAHQLACSIANL